LVQYQQLVVAQAEFGIVQLQDALAATVVVAETAQTIDLE
jgi:hypothetical protein